MIRHAKGVVCNHSHTMEVTKLSLVTCLACKHQLNNPDVLAEFSKLERETKVEEKKFVRAAVNILAVKAEEKGSKICLVCAADMKVRKNKKDGSSFWGCSNYPDCKATRKIN